MADNNPITTGELVRIGVKKLGKEIPILRSIIGAGDAVIGTIEMNRVTDTSKSLLANSFTVSCAMLACVALRGDPQSRA
jgi:hypothetical protein